MNGLMIRGAEVMGSAQGISQNLFDLHIIAVIVEPDSAQIRGIHKVTHGVEGYINRAIDVAFTFLHLGLQNSDNGEENAIEADGFADRPLAGEELGLGLGGNDTDVGALLILGAVEEAPLIDIELDDVLV